MCPGSLQAYMGWEQTTVNNRSATVSLRVRFIGGSSLNEVQIGALFIRQAAPQCLFVWRNAKFYFEFPMKSQYHEPRICDNLPPPAQVKLNNLPSFSSPIVHRLPDCRQRRRSKSMTTRRLYSFVVGIAVLILFVMFVSNDSASSAGRDKT